MKVIFKFVVAYFSFLILVISLLTLSHLIPTKKISENVNESIHTLKEEGVYPKIFNFKLFQLDNYTDALMLNIAVSVNNTDPLEASMFNYWYTSGNNRQIILDTKAVIDNNTYGLEKRSYGRYWQGYLIFLRPILTIMNYNQIRLLNFILLGLLFTIILYQIKNKININIMVLFLLTMLLISFPIVPLSMQFSTVFYISFISILIILEKLPYFQKQLNFLLLFFIIGACTSFFDFLTVPLLTLGLPLIVFVLMDDETNKYFLTIKASALWGAGYGITWASKWFIGGLITGVNILQVAMESAAVRTSYAYAGMEMTIPQIFRFSISMLNKFDLLWPLIGGIIIVIFFYIFLIKKGKTIIHHAYLLLIASMVPVWFLILRNHSIQHGWFTWRSLAVTLFAGFIFVYKTTDRKKFYNLFRNNRTNQPYGTNQ